jgi:hypothetical protein
MRRHCALALAALAALAIYPEVFGRGRSLSVMGAGTRSADEFAVPLLEAISQEREAGTTGLPLLSLVNVCPRWPFCNDAKVLVYTLIDEKVIFYWYRKDQPCSIEYHESGPCENGETNGFEILARIIESGNGGLKVKNGRLMWGNKYVYAFSLQGIQIHNFAFTGRIFFQQASRTRAYFSQAVSVSRNAITATGPARVEEGIIPGASESVHSHAVTTIAWVLCVGFVVVMLATIRRRHGHRKVVKDDEITSFLCSSLSNVSVADMSDGSIPDEVKEAAGNAWCPEKILKRALLDSPQDDCVDKDAPPIGSLGSTDLGSSGQSSSLSSSQFSDSMVAFAGTYSPVYRQEAMVLDNR